MNMHRRAVMGLGLAGAGLAVAAGAAAAGAEPAGALAVDGPGAERFAAAFEDIRAYAAQHMVAYGLPGLTLCAVAPGGTSAYLRFGYAELGGKVPLTPGHLFEIGSISKSFTALCVFHLMEAGKLSLDQDIATLLPGAPLPSGARITVQNLLNHSSGLPDDAPLFPRGGDGRLWRGFEPGSHWSYSNLGFLMLGTIVERLEGKPLAEVIRLRILTPLGMNATKGSILTGDRAAYAQGYSALYGDRGYPVAGPLGPGPWTEVTQGAGCVASTSHDMSLYCRWLIAAGQGKGAPILSDAGAARFTRATIDAPGWAARGAPQYANGLAVVEVGGRKLLHHTGGMLAYNSALHVDPQAGVGAFASTNVGLVPYRPRDITAFACERLREVVEGGPKATPSAAPPKTPPVEAYLGHYVSQGGAGLTVAATGRGIMARLGEEAVAMEPYEEDAFIAIAPQAAARPLVFRRTDKTVVRAWWNGVEFVRAVADRPVAAFSPATPATLLALTGWYGCDDPWHGGFRVAAQGEALFVDDVTPLIRLSDGSWRAGEKDWSPERMRFDAPIDGRPMRAIASGVDHLRRPVP
ncbi:serine hydrolase domain-containing protein [Phenylobacterium sp.]|uniref:serine hydrolase domain-containing protein n=1 Tax=Phenylobacterium sp. TaxID=1871053 RepID=UPI00121F0C79|nr:serine hydrolase domain-containing protein [Phenylobacterium sp.]THD57175.1 MAG: class A beta-lactamase-related serine hydrolase [Phenylobacterium sp.]